MHFKQISVLSEKIRINEVHASEKSGRSSFQNTRSTDIYNTLLRALLSAVLEE